MHRETAAGENASSYFPLLDRIADGTFAGIGTDKELYEKFLQVLQQGSHIATPDALSTFKLALSLRSAAPRVEAHYQYYDTAVEPSIHESQGNCPDWVLLDGKQHCSPSLDGAGASVAVESQLRELPFDRVLGSGAAEAILYADPTKPEFGPFHKALADKARKGDITYRLRYRTDQRGELAPLPVSGYGVELQLKRTDYIVIDDRDAEAQPEDDGSPPDPAAAEVNLDQEEDVADLKPLSSSELASLGLSAGSFIIQSEDPLQTLIKLTQDFPKFSTSVAAHNASDQFISEHRFNRAAMVPPGSNALWMNGVQLVERQIDPFTLVDSIRRERKMIKGVTDLGLTGQEAVALLGNREVSLAKSDDVPPRFDWRDELEDGQVIIWLNDLEKDKRYASYPKTIMAVSSIYCNQRVKCWLGPLTTISSLCAECIQARFLLLRRMSSTWSFPLTSVVPVTYLWLSRQFRGLYSASSPFGLV